MRAVEAGIANSKARHTSRIVARIAQLRKSRLRNLAVESLELRELLSTVPQLTQASAPISLFSPPGQGSVASPSIAIDPAHPNYMVAVWQRNDPNNTPFFNVSGSNTTFVDAAYSNNGGANWTEFNGNLGNAITDFTSSATPPAYFPVTSNPTISFDAHDNFYVVDEARKADYTAGEVVLNRFSMATGTPLWGSVNVLNSWNTGATPPSYPVFQPVVMADGNQASFGSQSDPNTGFVVGANTYGAVYVSWATEAVNSGNNQQNSNIQLLASANGGATFTGPVNLSAGGRFNGQEIVAAPSIAVSQGNGSSVTGGQVTVVWDDLGTGATSSLPFDRIMMAAESYNGTVLSVSKAERSIATTYVRGALNAAAATSPFPNAGSTAVSPLGIGPAPVIVSDNTLGANSPNEGRLYVAFTDNFDANGLPGTPADNSNIYLISSANGGNTWSGKVQVNDDNAQTDGFSEAQAGGNSGRPQFQPALAVDPVTGALAVSYLDARNDPSRARVATYVNVSIDGGQHFSPGQYANASLTTTDAITGQTVNLGPTPDNQSAGNGTSRDTTFGYGDHQGLAFYNGVVLPIWASNSNGGVTGSQGWTAALGKLNTAAGPRVISSTLGVVGESGDTINTARAADGTPIANAFQVVFDRPIDRNSLSAGNISITYLSPDGLYTSTFAPSLVTPVGVGATVTSFTVNFAFDPTVNTPGNPFGYVGTYSYKIAPNGAGANTPRSLISYINTSGSIVTGQPMNQSAVPANAGNASDAYTVTASAGTTVLPLIVPGPHVQSISLPGSSVVNGVVTVLNSASAVTSMTVVFDRNMDPTTLVTGSGVSPVVQMMGPAGQINVGTITVVAGGNLRTYIFSWPNTALSGTATEAQSLSGTYTVTLASTIKDARGNGLDSNLNAGVFKLQGFDPTAPTVSHSYGPGSGVSIPQAPTPVSSTITVPGSDNFAVRGISVALDISYPLPQDLTAILQGPDGAQVVLLQNIGGSTASGFNVTLDDTITPANPITNSNAPAGQQITGTYNPQFSLGNTFVTGNYKANGVWTLTLVSSDTTGLVGALNSWSLTLKSSTLGTGLGEPIADRASLGFRIFNDNPSILASTQQWTSVGPSPIVTNHPATGANAYKAGLVGALAVDPSDPSGNTVFAGGANGGVWKTTNFLTTAAAGPTWIPITDFGPNSQINVGTITVVPQKNAQGVFDPTKSIVIVGLGDGDTAAQPKPAVGLGFLISSDGGATFQKIQGTSPGDTTFATNTTYVWKIAVDPTPNPVNGKLIIYAALSGSAATAGIWRSQDGGTNWTLVLAGAATDVTLDQLSGQGVGGGVLQIVYAGLPGQGVFSSPNQGQSWFAMPGGIGDPLVQDLGTGAQIPVVGSPGAPTGNADGRILLAKPALSPGSTPANPSLADQIYEGWLYALVSTGGAMDGLYLTKDYGQNWTKVLLPMSVTAFGVFPSNDPNKAGAYDPAGNNGGYNLSFAMDPSNPDIVYIGGGGGGVSPGFLRVNVASIDDAHSFVPHQNNNNDGGQLTYNTTGGVSIANQNISSQLVNPLTGPPPHDASYLNLIRDPQNVFNVNATILSNNVNQFNNTGSGATIQTYLSADTQVEGFEPAMDYASSFHRLVAYTDPTTQQPRLIFGTDQGVFTGVDNNGVFIGGVSTASGQTGPIGNRNGNLSLTQFYYSAVQPSAHTPVGVVFYGGVRTEGAVNSSTLLSSGSTQWGSSYGTNLDSGDGNSYGVATDPSGTGTVYRFIPWAQAGTDFFQVQQNGTGKFISRTFGLTTGPGDGQWNSTTFNGGLTTFGNFGVNPVNGQQIVIVSNNGTIYRTENLGQTWFNIGSTGDGSYAPAVAFGAPKTVGNLDNFIYAGTIGGHIYVTTTGGGGAGNSWTDISGGLDGSTVQRIIANPARNSTNAYAVTLKGVYYNANTTGGGTWTNISGNLFSQAAALVSPVVTDLTALQIDWRYIIPDNPAAPSGPSHPVLYVSGNVGVYRSLDKGTTWTVFPTNNPQLDSTNTQQNVLAQTGGYLPNTKVSDINLVTGNVSSVNGRSTWQTGDPNMLVASTYGRGQFMIQLAPSVMPNAKQNQPGWISITNPTLTTNDGTQVVVTTANSLNSPQIVVRGYSEQTNFGNTASVAMYDMTNPASPVLINLAGSTTTDPNTGQFLLTIPAGTFSSLPTTGKFITIGLQATDQSGAKGNMALYTFVVQPNPVQPVVSLLLDPLADSSPTGAPVAYNHDQYTFFNNSAVTPLPSNAPFFDVTGVIAPPAGQQTTVVLLRAERVNGVLGSYAEVARQTYSVGGTVVIADTNGGNGTILDNPANAPPDSPPNQLNQYQYRAYQIDWTNLQSGNYSAPKGVIVDTQNPVSPTKIALEGATDSGTSSTDLYTYYNNSPQHTAPVFDVSGIEPHGTVVLLRSQSINGVLSTPVIVNTLYDTAGGIVPIADINGGNGTIPDSPVGSPIDTPLPVGNPYIYSAYQVDLAGNPSRDTGFGNQGAVVIDGTDSNDHGDSNGPGNTNENGWLYMQKVVELIAPNVTNNQRTLVAIGDVPGTDVFANHAAQAIQSAFAQSPLPNQGWRIVFVDGVTNIDNFFKGQNVPVTDVAGNPIAGGIRDNQAGILYLPTVDNTAGDMSQAELTVVNNYGPIIQSLVNGGAGLFAQAEGSGFSFGGNNFPFWGWLSDIFPGITPVQQTGGAFFGGGGTTIQITPIGQQVFPGLTPADLSTGPWHNYFTGNFGALASAVTDLDDNGNRQTLILTSAGVKLPPASLIIDSTPPAISSITLDPSTDSGKLNNDDVTSFNNNPKPPIFDVTGVEPNGIVQLYRAPVVGGVTGASVLVNTFSIGQVPAITSVQIADTNAGNGTIPDGTYVYTTRQTDLAGNVGPFSAGLTVIVIAAPPGAVGPFRLDPVYDTGTFNNDGITRDNNSTLYPAPVFDASGVVANGVLNLYRAPFVGGVAGTPVLVNSVSVTTGGLVKIADINTPSSNALIPDGVYIYTAQQLDLAGNVSPLSAAITVTIDSDGPQADPPAKPSLEPGSDTGTSNSDQITQDNNSSQYPAPIFDAGTVANPVEAGATVQLYRAPVVNGVTQAAVLVKTLTNTAGGIVPIADTNGGNGTIPDGTYMYTVQYTDLAGVLGSFSAGLKVVIAAATPSLPQPFRLDANSDTGVSNSDGITQVTLFKHPVFDAGGIVPGGTVKLFRNGVLVNTLTNTAGGLVLIPDNDVLPDGTYVYTVQQIDLNGNAGPIGGAITVVYDTAQPLTPSAPVLAPASDTGVKGDKVTSNTSPFFNITVNVSGFELNSSLTLLRDGNPVATSPYTITTNSVSIQDTGPVAFGAHVYQAFITDLAGNKSVLGGPVTVTFANDSPGTLSLDPNSDSGLKGDNVTNVTSPTFDVLGVAANGTLRLLRNGLTVANIPTGAGGTLMITDPGPLTSGVYTYNAQQVDAGGNVSLPGPALRLTVDTVVPVAPTSFKLDPNSDSGFKGDNLTNVTNPTFDASGIITGATVNLYRDGTKVATFIPLVGGTIAITDPGIVPDGVHAYLVQQVSVAGNVSPNSAPQSITIDTVIPPSPPLALSAKSDSGPKGDNITSIVNPFFDASQVVAGATLKLFRNGLNIKLLANVAGGTVQIQDPGPLPDGTYTFTAQQISQAGNVSVLGTPLVITINTQPPLTPTTPTLSLDPSTDTGILGDNITSSRRPTIDVGADPGVTVTLYDGTGKAISSNTADLSGALTFTLPFNLADGVYSYTAQATDAKGQVSAKSTPLTITLVTLQGDYNGTGQAVPALFRRVNPYTATWFIPSNPALTSRSFGAGGIDIPLTGDFDGDGKMDLAVYRPSTGQWFVQESSNGYVGLGHPFVTFGLQNLDIPVPGNYNGPGATVPAVYRPTTGEWIVLYKAGTPVRIGGQAGDIPVPGDYNNTGTDVPAVYRPSANLWIIQGPAGTPVTTISFGGSTDDPVPGAYDATVSNHAVEPAVYRPTTGQFFIHGPNGNRMVQFAPGDIPAPGDYDGIGKTEPAVFRPSTGQWFVMGPNDTAPRLIMPSLLGTLGDIPTLSPYRYRALPGKTGVGGGTILAASVDLSPSVTTIGVPAGSTTSATTFASAATSQAPTVSVSASRLRPNQHLVVVGQGHSQTSQVIHKTPASSAFNRRRRSR